MSNELVERPVCTCELDRERTVTRCFEVAPASGGGTAAWATAFGRLVSRLAALPTHCVVVTQHPNQRYVQLLVGHGRVHAEASSNRFLEGDFRLGPSEGEYLRILGFTAPSDAADPEGPCNWVFDRPAADPISVADVLAHTMVAVMCFDERHPVTIEVFGAAEPCEVCSWGTP